MDAFVLRMILAGGAILSIATATGHAQFQMAPGFAQSAYSVGTNAGNPAVSSFGASNLGPYAAMSSSNSSLGSPSAVTDYYPPATTSGILYQMYPVTNTGNLYGSAAVINAFTQYEIATQQAKLMQQQVRRERLANRRRMIEQWLWERNNLPTTEDDRERLMHFALRRSQANPPETEIFAGRSLNDLLNDAERLQTQGVKGQELPLNGIDLSQINFVPAGNGDANTASLKDFQNRNEMDWPVALRGEEFQKERDLLTPLLRDAARQARTNGRVDIGTLREIGRCLDQLSNQLRLDLNQKDLSPSLYNPARNFINELGNALRALSGPDARSYFNGKYAAQGQTVADLVSDMRNKGLSFGPATPGQRSAYKALQRLLAAYDVSLNSSSLVSQAR